MAWIEKRSKGYLVRWKEPDGSPASRMTTSHTEARTLRADVERELLSGSYVLKALREETFGAFAAEVIDSSLDLEASTLHSYAAVMGKWILPGLGHLKMEEVSQRALRKFFSDMALRGAGAPTQDKVRRIVSKILRQAVEEGVLPRNPLRGVRVAKHEAPEIRVLPPEQVTALAAAIRPRYRPMVSLAAYGQLRFGEIAALKPVHIDYEQGRVHVRQALKSGAEGLYVGPPKTAAGRRTVSLPPFLMAELAEHQLQYLHDGWLFTTHQGNLLARGAFWPVWREATSSAGFSEPIPRFHDLRHTGVSVLIKQGWSANAIAKRVGHSKPSMTLDVYGHLFPGDEEAMAAGLEAFAPGSDAKVVNLHG